MFLQTGQITCHDAFGREIACAGSGQDAEFQTGLPWPEARFLICGETVADRLTGLSWSLDANPAEYPMTWQEALDWVAARNQWATTGFRDWRLPNRRELRSLISHQARRPALPAGHPFLNVFPSWYWTSTSAVISPSHAWYVDMDGGRMFFGGKDQAFLVWPVRGAGSDLLPVTGQSGCFDATGTPVACRGSGQDAELRCGMPWPEPRFHTADDVVIDGLTGLRWSRAAGITAGPLSWQEALSAARNLNDERSDAHAWRLPNINELESLVDCGRHTPALSGDDTFEQLQDVYWSSTTSLFEPDWAWALYLDKGAIGVGQKTQARFHVWVVQDGLDQQHRQSRKP